MVDIEYGSELAKKDNLIDALQERVRCLESINASLWEDLGDLQTRITDRDDALGEAKRLAEAVLKYLDETFGMVPSKNYKAFDLESMAHKVLAVIPEDEF